MRISTEISSIAAFSGEEEAVRLVAEAGFDAWDFSMFAMFRYDYATQRILPSDHVLGGKDALKLARRLKQIGEENGIVCNQAHAPFPPVWPDSRDYMLRAIECTAEAGGKICVVHPGNSRTPEENAEMYRELLPFAKACGIRIATENMFNWDHEKDDSLAAACSTPESFLAHLDAVNDPDLVVCLDLGHAEMRGLGTSACANIRALGSRIQALHIHDNDKRHDQHLLPYTGQIDMDAIADTLREVGYAGECTLESYGFLRTLPAGADLKAGVRRMAEAARRFADRVTLK